MRIVLALLLVFVPLPAFADPAGTWALYIVEQGEITNATRLELARNGETVTGMGRDLRVAGTFRGDSLVLAASRPNGQTMGEMRITLTGDKAAGTFRRGNTEYPLQLTRLPLRSAPKTVTFEPNAYPRLFATAAAALTVNAGDTIRTSTLDAAGRDSGDVFRALGGNPQNGPIHVAGAIPGDTLAVTIKAIRLNRAVARGGNTLVAGTVTNEYAQGARYEGAPAGEWRIDRASATAQLANPSERLRDFRIALKPMIGGMGVAPPRGEAFRAQQQGVFGGNLDYPGLIEGVTVYLPVMVEGALLYVGDVHAQQGAGELNGDALEISADLELTVDVIPGFASNSPRAENADHLMSFGIGGTMEGALRQATTEMARWLERDYGLSAGESALVLGTAIQYDIAEVLEPNFTIVAKISKSALAPLKRAP